MSRIMPCGHSSSEWDSEYACTICGPAEAEQRVIKRIKALQFINTSELEQFHIQRLLNRLAGECKPVGWQWDELQRAIDKAVEQETAEIPALISVSDSPTHQ